MEKKIKLFMLQKGIRQVDIAKELGVSRVAVCRVIKGLSKSRRIRQRIADVLDMKVDELWLK